MQCDLYVYQKSAMSKPNNSPCTFLYLHLLLYHRGNQKHTGFHIEDYIKIVYLEIYFLLELFYFGKIHKTKFAILIILNAPFSGIKYMLLCNHPHHPSLELFYHPKFCVPISPPPASSTPHSFCLYVFEYSMYLM